MEEKLLDILKDVFEDDSINSTVAMSNYSSWDSLKHLNLVIELEEEFDVSFTPDEIGKMKSFVDIIAILNKKIS